MITIRVWGGIGNQLFQYAFGEYLRLTIKQKVCYDIASFENPAYKLRKLELKILNPQLPLSTSIVFSRYTKHKSKFYRLLFQLNPQNKFIKQKNFSLEDAYNFNDNKHYYLQGYWQDSVYPDVILKKDDNFFVPQENFPPELEAIKKTINETMCSVALHIRRGDYFCDKNVGVFGVCDAAYYHRAIELICQKDHNAKIFVFSDDLDWVKNNINLPKNVVYVPNLDINPYWYIVLMSQCKHNIISNSSFSWWGAYLNPNKEKIVICPQQWMLNSEKTLALSTWLKM